MFVIEANNKAQIVGNSVDDNFLKFMPKVCKCDLSEIKAYYISKENEEEIRSFIKEDPKNRFMRAELGGKISVLTRLEGKEEPAMQDTYSGRLVKKAYDDNGKFIGHIF